MATHKQAEKRHRQSLKRNARNKHAKTGMRTHIKRANAAIESGADDAGAAVEMACSAVDKVRQKGIIHANTAARTIGRIKKAYSKSQS